MKEVKNSKWNSPALKQIRDIVWGCRVFVFIDKVLHPGESTSDRLAEIDSDRLAKIYAANAKRVRRMKRNLLRQASR